MVVPFWKILRRGGKDSQSLNEDSAIEGGHGQGDLVKWTACRKKGVLRCPG